MYKKVYLSTSQKNADLNDIYPEGLNNCVLPKKMVLFDNSEKPDMINSKTELVNGHKYDSFHCVNYDKTKLNLQGSSLTQDDFKAPEDFGSLENYNRNLEKGNIVVTKSITSNYHESSDSKSNFTRELIADMVQNGDDSNDSDFDYNQEVNVDDFEYIDIPWNPPELFQK